MIQNLNIEEALSCLKKLSTVVSEKEGSVVIQIFWNGEWGFVVELGGIIIAAAPPDGNFKLFSFRNYEKTKPIVDNLNEILKHKA